MLLIYEGILTVPLRLSGVFLPAMLAVIIAINQSFLAVAKTLAFL